MVLEKILVVDDEVDVLTLIKIELESEGYQVFTATTGGEAINKAKQTLPDLILMDVILPDMTGGEAIKALKKDPAMSRIPAIFLTALFSKKEEKDHAMLNVDDHEYLTIAKPFTPGELLTIKKTLGKKGLAGKKN